MSGAVWGADIQTVCISRKARNSKCYFASYLVFWACQLHSPDGASWVYAWSRHSRAADRQPVLTVRKYAEHLTWGTYYSHEQNHFDYLTYLAKRQAANIIRGRPPHKITSVVSPSWDHVVGRRQKLTDGVGSGHVDGFWCNYTVDRSTTLFSVLRSAEKSATAGLKAEEGSAKV